ncbi:hypothetical protein [Pseudomonas aeruginosa]
MNETTDIELVQADELSAIALAEQAMILSELVELSHTSPENAAGLLRDYASPDQIHPRLAFLRVAVVDAISRNLQAGRHDASGTTEFDVHRHFWSNPDSLLPGAVRIARKHDGENIPDGWVELEGEQMPVEIKLGAFNQSASRQLRRYLLAYSARRGVAVGSDITCAKDDRLVCIRHGLTGPQAA